jgi:hypothetical protein
MALATSPHNSSMQITYHLGIDDDGKDKTISRSLTNIKSEETDENLFGLVNSIIGLQKYPAIRVLRLDRTEFEED